MKKLLTLFSVSILLLSFKSDKIKNALTRSNLKGKVKTLSEEIYGVKPKTSDQEGTLFDKINITYNEQGNVSKSKRVSSKGIIFLSASFTYNNLGEMVYEIDTSAKGLFMDTDIYDASGNMIEIHSIRDNGPGKPKTNIKSIIKYDGDVERQYDYYINNKLVNTLAYEYDADGKIISASKLKPNGKVEYKTTYQYDDNGNIIEQDYYNPHNKLKYTTHYKYEAYDSQGNWTKRINYYEKRPVNITERRFTYY